MTFDLEQVIDRYTASGSSMMRISVALWLTSNTWQTERTAEDVEPAAGGGAIVVALVCLAVTYLENGTVPLIRPSSDYCQHSN